MVARKVLHDEVSRVNKLLNKRKEAGKQEVGEFVIEDNQEAKILPYKRKLLAKQYYKLRETLADYIDNTQVKLFDQAIRIMDRVHISREDKTDN